MAPPKYARLENERRFLVAPASAPDLTKAPFVLIKDLYVRETRLRLRSITDPATGQRTFKLCKKYPSDDGLSAPIVNVYLGAEEYALLSRLPGWFIRKRRHALPVDEHSMSLDVFLGDLSGLVLCEVEAASREAVAAIPPPPWATREVTEDPAFTGGELCRIPAESLAALLGPSSGSGRA